MLTFAVGTSDDNCKITLAKDSVEWDMAPTAVQTGFNQELYMAILQSPIDCLCVVTFEPGEGWNMNPRWKWLSRFADIDSEGTHR